MQLYFCSYLQPHHINGLEKVVSLSISFLSFNQLQVETIPLLHLLTYFPLSLSSKVMCITLIF